MMLEDLAIILAAVWLAGLALSVVRGLRGSRDAR